MYNLYLGVIGEMTNGRAIKGSHVADDWQTPGGYPVLSRMYGLHDLACQSYHIREFHGCLYLEWYRSWSL
jgi:hypothetical protein